jgi:hypothetical protein
MTSSSSDNKVETSTGSGQGAASFKKLSCIDIFIIFPFFAVHPDTATRTKAVHVKNFFGRGFSPAAPAIDNASGKRHIGVVMSQPQRAARKKPEYPEETAGSRLGARPARWPAN